MKPSDIAAELETRANLKRIWLGALVISVTTNLLLAVGLATADRTHREIVVPPEINKTFWIEDKKASASYLEQMGLFMLMNALNVTPLSADYQMKQILKYTTPAYYGTLEKHLTAQAKRLVRDNVSTTISVTGITVDENRQAVLFDAVLNTALADKRVSQEAKKYEVLFTMNNGRIYLNELRELDEKGMPVSADGGSGAQ